MSLRLLLYLCLSSPLWLLLLNRRQQTAVNYRYARGLRSLMIFIAIRVVVEQLAKFETDTVHSLRPQKSAETNVLTFSILAFLCGVCEARANVDDLPWR